MGSKRKMKASIFVIKRFAVHDGDGIRTTVFFKGCPLKCVWCHNPEGISTQAELAYFAHKCIHCGECVSACPTGAHTMADGLHIFYRDRCIACGNCEAACLGDALAFYGKEYTVDALLPLLLKDKDFHQTSGGGVTLSGGECLLYADFCAELLKALKEQGIHTAVDTCGMVMKEAFDKVLPYTDVFLYDVKARFEETHIRCTGRSNAKILDNLTYLDERGAKIEIRIPLVPDFNERELEEVGVFLSGLKNVTKVRLLSYHNLAGSKYEALGMKNTLPERVPTQHEATMYANMLKKHGLAVVE